jgi:hypothetical protein
VAPRALILLIGALVLVIASPLPARSQDGEAPTTSRGNPSIQFAGQSIDAMIGAFMQDHGVPGLTVAIVQAPYITRSTGFGVSDVERRTLAASNTIFDIGPMKDAFTAVAVMQLVERGAIGLDDPLPGAPSTVRASLLRPADYGLLERLVADASGVTYRQWVKTHQFERLGVRNTFFTEDLPSAPGPINPIEPATGYRDGQPVPARDGAIYSSAFDLSFWDIALAGEILIKDAALRQILYSPAGPGTPTSGAWYFPGHPGLMVVTGNRDGFSSLLARFTRADELVCVTLLANKEGLDLTQLARTIAGAYDTRIGPPPGLARLRVQQSPYALGDTVARLDRVLRERGWPTARGSATSIDVVVPPAHALLRVTVSEENGEIWLGATDPAASPGRRLDRETALQTRDQIDAALLQAVSFP